MSDESKNGQELTTAPEDNKEVAAPQEQIVYKMSPELRATLYAYLNNRPMDEVNDFMIQMFEIEEKDPYYTAAAIQDISKYLRAKCPRHEAKPLLEAMVQTNAIMRYRMIPNVVAETPATVGASADTAGGTMEVVKD